MSSKPDASKRQASPSAIQDEQPDPKQAKHGGDEDEPLDDEGESGTRAREKIVKVRVMVPSKPATLEGVFEAAFLSRGCLKSLYHIAIEIGGLNQMNETFVHKR